MTGRTTSDSGNEARRATAIEALDALLLQSLGAAPTLDGLLEAALGIFECQRVWLAYEAPGGDGAWLVEREATLAEYPGALAQRGGAVESTPFGTDLLQMLGATDTVIVLDEAHHPLPSGDELVASMLIRAAMVVRVRPQSGRERILGLHYCERDDVPDWAPAPSRATDRPLRKCSRARSRHGRPETQRGSLPNHRGRSARGDRSLRPQFGALRAGEQSGC